MIKRLRTRFALNTLGLLSLVFWTGAALAQDPVKAFPNNYSLALENDTVAVIRVHYGPHEKVGVHEHSAFPTVYVYLSDSGPVHFQHFEEKGFATTRPPTRQGSFRVSPGRIERHTVENMGDLSSDFLRVELKKLTLGKLELTRVAAPPDLLKSAVTTEFTSPTLQIDRIVCAASPSSPNPSLPSPSLPNHPCPIEPSASPSLLVAFTAVSEAGNTPADNATLQAGAVRWLPAGQALTISGNPGSPAHLLRIILPAASK